jgi:hypothetical protein
MQAGVEWEAAGFLGMSVEIREGRDLPATVADPGNY